MAKTYCPRCGTMMVQCDLEGRIRETCPTCRYIHYRNPVPAVGVVVRLNDGVVLVRRKFDPQLGYWGLPAGYMEMGESAEEAAIRECHEETGLLIHVNHLLGVYSYGDDDFSGLVIIYAATATGGKLQAGDDATEAAIFSVDALPSPMAFRTHLQAIERWRREEYAIATQHDMHIHSTHGILVRHANRSDDDHVLALLPLLPHYQSPNDMQLLSADALFHDRLHDPDRPVLVAEVEGVVVGFAAISFRQTLIGWRASIDELVVEPTYRRRGLGHALAEAAARLAQSRHCHTLHIDTTQGGPEAQSFYHACGFVNHGVATLRIG